MYPLVAMATIAAAIASGIAGPEHATPPRTGQPLAATMRVAKDPVTGQIVTPEYTGTPLSVEAMQALARLEAAGLVTIHNADGSETLNSEGRFMDFSVIRVGPDGKRLFQCAHGRLGMEHALLHAAPATPNQEDR
jgi:hypothetical protein